MQLAKTPMTPAAAAAAWQALALAAIDEYRQVNR